MTEKSVLIVCSLCSALHRAEDTEAHREWHRYQISPMALGMLISTWLEAQP